MSPALVLALAVCASPPDPASLPPLSSPSPPPRVSPVVLVQSDWVTYAGRTNAPAAGDPVDHAGFRLRRARLGGQAAAENWRARLVFETFADGDVGRAVGTPPSPRVTEAFVGWGRGKRLRVDAGALRVPFSLSRQTDEADLPLPERAAIVQASAPEFRAGAAISGDLGHFQYAAGVYDAAPQLDAAFQSGGVLYAGRIAAEPVGPVGVAPWLRPSGDPWYGWWRFAIGASAFYESAFGLDNWGAGGDAQLQWGAFSVAAEVLWVRRLPQRIGFYVEPGWFLVRDRLFVAARFESYESTLDQPDPDDAIAIIGGLTYFIPATPLRLSAAYAHRRERTPHHRTNDWALVRATLALF